MKGRYTHFEIKILLSEKSSLRFPTHAYRRIRYGLFLCHLHECWSRNFIYVNIFNYILNINIMVKTCMVKCCHTLR